MRPFRMPRTNKLARVFTRVETVDPQYDIYDVGIQHENGDIDSVAVGGSFASAKRWLTEFDKRDANLIEVQAQADVDQQAVEQGEPLTTIDKQPKVAVTV